MNKKAERQLSFLLPITNKRNSNLQLNSSSLSALRERVDADKTYLKIRESLRNKGLVKPR